MQQDRGRRRKRGVTEAEEDAAFAAEMLGLVYDRVKDVGDALRVVGDTAGGLAGGSFKLLSASVNVRKWCLVVGRTYICSTSIQQRLT